MFDGKAERKRADDLDKTLSKEKQAHDNTKAELSALKAELSHRRAAEAYRNVPQQDYDELKRRHDLLLHALNRIEVRGDTASKCKAMAHKAIMGEEVTGAEDMDEHGRVR